MNKKKTNSKSSFCLFPPLRWRNGIDKKITKFWSFLRHFRLVQRFPTLIAPQPPSKKIKEVRKHLYIEFLSHSILLLHCHWTYSKTQREKHQACVHNMKFQTFQCEDWSWTSSLSIFMRGCSATKRCNNVLCIQYIHVCSVLNSDYTTANKRASCLISFSAVMQ